MAAGPEHRDIEAWLAAKLEDPWSSEKIASLLTKDILVHAKAKFSTMEVPLKLKLLFSFVSLRKKILKDLEEDIMDIFQIAMKDDDEWVRIMGQILDTLPLDKVTVEGVDAFIKSSDRIRSLLSKGEPQFFPLEYQYLNKELLPTTVNAAAAAEVSTHFKLKKHNSQDSMQFQTPKKSIGLRASLDTVNPPQFRGSSSESPSNAPRTKPLESPPSINTSSNTLKKSYDVSDDRDELRSSHTSLNSSDNWSRNKNASRLNMSTGLDSASHNPLRNSSNNTMFGRGTDGGGSSSSSSAGGLGERRGFQKKNRMQIIGIDEVKSITNQQEDMKKRKHGQIGEEGEAPEESEKMRKKREKLEEQEKKKVEREEKKKKKQEEVQQKKQLMEERRAEKEAKKSQVQAMKALKRSGKIGPGESYDEGMQAEGVPGLADSGAVPPPTMTPQESAYASPVLSSAMPASPVASAVATAQSTLTTLPTTISVPPNAASASAITPKKPISFAKPQDVASAPLGAAAYLPGGSNLYTQQHASLLSQVPLKTSEQNPLQPSNIPTSITPTSVTTPGNTKESLSSLLSQALLPQSSTTTTTALPASTNTPYTFTAPAAAVMQAAASQPIVTPLSTIPPSLATPFGTTQVQQVAATSLFPGITQNTTNMQTTYSVPFSRPTPTQPAPPPPSAAAAAPSVLMPAQSTPTANQPSTLAPTLTPEEVAQQQQQTQALLKSLFEQANQLTPENKEIIIQFLSGNRTNPNPAEGPIKQIQLNFEQKVNPENNATLFAEMIFFEIDYNSGSWRKFRRKKNVQRTNDTQPQ